MREAYRSARRLGYSRYGAARLGVLLARLARNDPPTDVWGRPPGARGGPADAPQRRGTA